MEAHLRADVRQPSCLEVTATHPILNRAEDMLDGASMDPHGIWYAVEAILHGFHHMLVLPARHPPFVAGGATRLQRA